MLLNSFYFYLNIIAHQFLHQKSFSKEEEERAAKPGYVQNNLKVCFAKCFTTNSIYRINHFSAGQFQCEDCGICRPKYDEKCSLKYADTLSRYQ